MVFVDGDDHDVVSWATVHDEAKAVAAGLQERGIRPGDHVALLGPTSRHLVTAIQGIWLAGATIVVLPLPMRMASIESFVDSTRLRIHHSDSRLVLVDAELMPFIEPVADDPPMVLLDDIAAEASSWFRPVVDPDSYAILQFTSGSTSDPKGVVLPHRTVCANLDALCSAAELDIDDDVLISWLPLYHDMGLVGLLCTSMTTGCGLVLGAPQDFMGSPMRWMEWISTYRGTATAGPNFSYVLATRALHRAEASGVTDLDLSSMRVALNGAEPIDPHTVEAFCEAGAAFGLRPESAFCAFGMAEIAIAGTFPVPGAGMRTDAVDQRVLETERYAAPVAHNADNVRRIPILGRAVPGLEIRVVDPETGTPQLDREVGELEIRGTSVTPGYYKRPADNARLFRDGWLRTGDLAYLIDGEMVMCGRIKDVIIVGGRNVFPEDVERALVSVEGVRAGNVIAFGVDGGHGKEHMVVVAESKASELGPVRRTVTETVRLAVGVPPKDVVLVSPGTLPKTSSGKLQRSLCKQQYLDSLLVSV